MKENSSFKYNNHLVVLAHGILKDGRDMRFIEKGLVENGFKTVSVDLPLTFGSLQDAYKAMKRQVGHMFNEYETVHFVGYSMGGLVIQKFLSLNKINNLGNCVFIASPSKGSRLADIADSIPLLGKIFKPLKDLRTRRKLDNFFKFNRKIRLGIIAGTKNKQLLSKLFMSKNSDGMVEVHSTKLDEMHEFTVFPYAHKDIHFQEDVVDSVCYFIKHGTFIKELETE